MNLRTEAGNLQMKFSLILLLALFIIILDQSIFTVIFARVTLVVIMSRAIFVSTLAELIFAVRVEVGTNFSLAISGMIGVFWRYGHNHEIQ